MKAKYILRFDDINPQMNWKIWDEIISILDKHKIKPILSVIPDNKDNSIIYSRSISKSNFWKLIREYQLSGYDIAIHGYQHLFHTKNSGDFVKINNYSEFAGLPEKVQEEKIIKAKKIFEKNGIFSEIFVAPAHTFDKITIKVLNKNGFKVISDGFFLYPRIRFNLIWVPQQLWWFKKMPFGLYTICFHHNSWDKNQLENFRNQISCFKNDIISFQEAIRIFPPKKFNILDKIMNNLINKFLKIKNWKNYEKESKFAY